MEIYAVEKHHTKIELPDKITGDDENFIKFQEKKLKVDQSSIVCEAS